MVEAQAKTVEKAQTADKAKAVDKVKTGIRKATGSDFRDEFTKFADAATTILTGVHAASIDTQRELDTRTDALEAKITKNHEAATARMDGLDRDVQELQDAQATNLRSEVVKRAQQRTEQVAINEDLRNHTVSLIDQVASMKGTIDAERAACEVSKKRSTAMLWTAIGLTGLNVILLLVTRFA